MKRRIPKRLLIPVLLIVGLNRRLLSIQPLLNNIVDGIIVLREHKQRMREHGE